MKSADFSRQQACAVRYSCMPTKRWRCPTSYAKSHQVVMMSPGAKAQLLLVPSVGTQCNILQRSTQLPWSSMNAVVAYAGQPGKDGTTAGVYTHVLYVTRAVWRIPVTFLCTADILTRSQIHTSLSSISAYRMKIGSHLTSTRS